MSPLLCSVDVRKGLFMNEQPTPQHNTIPSGGVSHHSNGSTASLTQDTQVRKDKTIIVEDLIHVDIVLEASKHHAAEFSENLVRLLRDQLSVKSWAGQLSLSSGSLTIHRVSGSWTNAVYFVSAPLAHPQPQQILLRIYGPSSGSLICRPMELYALRVLSSRYNIGPHVLGTFENGRVEEYFDSRPLTEEDVRDPQISRWIGRRMSELHNVDIGEVVLNGDGWKDKGLVSAKINFQNWFPVAEDIIASVDASSLPMDHPWRSFVKGIDLGRLKREGKAYWSWIEDFESKHGESKRVFAHNDGHCGNFLRLTTPPKNKPPHHQIIIVDFEYAAPNPAAFDIATHFHEWTTNNSSETATHVLEQSRYPTVEQRENFYRAYLYPLPTGPYDELLVSDPLDSLSSSSPANLVTADAQAIEDKITCLDSQVKAWSPASHAFCTIWAILQGRDDLEVGNGSGGFNYLGYAMTRAEAFRREINVLGVEIN